MNSLYTSNARFVDSQAGYIVHCLMVLLEDCLNVKSKEERVVYKRLNTQRGVDSENNHGGSSTNMCYIGLDVHKKTISYCVKEASGHIHSEGKVGATRCELDDWMKTLPRPRTVAMEATIFTGWIYDHLLPHAAQVKVAHPVMLLKKGPIGSTPARLQIVYAAIFFPNDMVSTEIRARPHPTVATSTGASDRSDEEPNLLLETGVSHNKQKVHKVGSYG